MAKIYHTLEDGRILEVRNWRQLQREQSYPVLIALPLKGIKAQKYHVLRSIGLTDSQIFFKLNPSILDRRLEKKTVIEIPVETLDEKQLRWLIEKRISEKLDKLSKRDLVKLLLALSK